MIIIPPCLLCKYIDDKEWVCPAYPDGIPEDIRTNGIDKTVLCGNGYLYTPKYEPKEIEPPSKSDKEDLINLLKDDFEVIFIDGPMND